jgi:hypothetical protein
MGIVDMRSAASPRSKELSTEEGDMKNIIFSSLLIVILGVIGFGQGGQNQTSGTTVTGGSSQSSNVDASTHAGRNSGELSLAQGTRIDGELQNTLDVKNARVGDKVLLKTTRDIKQNGRTVIAKGSTLAGHVTDVAQRSKQNAQSRLGILFDRVQGHGLDMPVTASIVSITNAAASASVADVADADLMGSTMTSGSTSSGRSSSRSSSGGGLLNGVGNTVGGVSNGVTNTTGSVVNTTRQTVGGVTNTTGQTVGNTVGGVTRSTGGLQIMNSGSTNASAGNGSVLASSTQNIRLEKGSMVGVQLDSSASASASRSH